VLHPKYYLYPMSHSYISYWEHDVWLKDIDIAIIGSGIVGLSSAYFLKQKYPNKKIVVFERGFLPHGATTRNAGFSCFGSTTEIISDIEKNGKDRAYQLVKERFDGLNALIQLHGPEKIRYENLGGYEVFTTGEEEKFEKASAALSWLNKEIAEVLNIKSNTYTVSDPGRSSELGIKNIAGMIFNPWEGQLHSGLLIKNLVHLCRTAGVEIITGINIQSFSSSPEHVNLFALDQIEIKAKQLVITVNGFAKSLVPALDVQPARGQVLVTSPIKDLKLKGAFHHNEGFDYFRNIGDRVLLGGGRDLDMEKEITPEMERNDKIYAYLKRFLSETVIPGREFEIEFEWSGTMGVGKEKSPIIQYIHPNVLVAVRMGGMGVAIGTNVGKKVAGLA
jgi:gamma-glutamylputrescine oxidase